MPFDNKIFKPSLTLKGTMKLPLYAQWDTKNGKLDLTVSIFDAVDHCFSGYLIFLKFQN